MHSSLRGFLAEPASDVGTKAGSHAFGLIALGKFILRLPAEVLEEELPRLKQTLIAVRLFVPPIWFRAALMTVVVV